MLLERTGELPCYLITMFITCIFYRSYFHLERMIKYSVVMSNLIDLGKQIIALFSKFITALALMSATIDAVHQKLYYVSSSFNRLTNAAIAVPRGIYQAMQATLGCTLKATSILVSSLMLKIVQVLSIFAPYTSHQRLRTPEVDKNQNKRI